MADVGTRERSPGGGVRSWAGRHQLVVYFALAYAWSWTWWAPLLLGAGGTVLLLLGGFGPLLAAAAATRLAGEPLRPWARAIVRWRVPVRWWAWALGLPALLYAVVNLVLVALGREVDWSLALARAPAYLAGFAFVAVLGGGLEEPGWRGFALPRLQARLGPLRATALLGLLWGVWHVPLYGPLGFAVPFVLAFFYTPLYNRTRSVLLCVLLHASFTPSQDHLVLLAADPVHTGLLDVVDLVLFGTYAGAALIVVGLTRGRLGDPGSRRRLSPAAPPGRPPRAGR
ncbi:CPBP family intramembrane glutamic endopeptidase [Kocuria oceani]|uniref:CPBP family intramembrane glutamic endopeptidase n=1 Tax=Kocuria oceani TaxID=988827 RepID=A0ABV9TMN9_9MICC|nr:type II CAAX endopeptidase family protein [Kocuria oceani]